VKENIPLTAVEDSAEKASRKVDVALSLGVAQPDPRTSVINPATAFKRIILIVFLLISAM
jgi:hypothetical protein